MYKFIEGTIHSGTTLYESSEFHSVAQEKGKDHNMSHESSPLPFNE